MSKLLNAGNYKTRKGEKYGWKTYGIHLSPNIVSGYNVCFDATTGCIDACLDTSGRGAMPSVQTARTNKTKRFFEDRKGFLTDLWKEVTSAVKSATKKELKTRAIIEGKTLSCLLRDVCEEEANKEYEVQ